LNTEEITVYSEFDFNVNYMPEHRIFRLKYISRDGSTVQFTVDDRAYSDILSVMIKAQKDFNLELAQKYLDKMREKDEQNKLDN